MATQAMFVILCLMLTKECYTRDLSEDGNLDFLRLATKYGYEAIEYVVVTEDGYILKLFRIPGTSKTPILLMHGLADTSDTWIIRGNRSLAITLANQGHDVWVGNCRGNKYGRNNIFLDPDSDEFWDFSFHEHGFYDLPAIIDTVLNTTKAGKLNAIGHSQGNSIFYVLGSTKPEYNAKVNVLLALAPICFLQNIQPPLASLIKISPAANALAQVLGVREIFGKNSVIIHTWRHVCPKPIIGYSTCILGILFPLSGYDSEELEVNFVPTMVGHFPNGISEKNLYHFAQLNLRGKFAQYDYGTLLNLAKYNNETPPEYELRAVTMNIALLVGANDKLATVEDVAKLRLRLPNAQYLLLPRRKMNHADFIWGRHMDEYLYPYIFNILRNYTDNVVP